ncbi:MAG: hypothetical protein LUD12_00335 [Lachnospiraceae bacterium]|nr:hypothetical protein [Lachnospiraceae bacterium]
MRKRNFATKTAAVILSAAMALSACPAFAAETDSSEEIPDAGAEVILDAEADTVVTDETTAAEEAVDDETTEADADEAAASGTEESAAAVTNEAADDGSQDTALVISVEEYTGDDLDTEALIAETSETETESAETVTSGYGTLSMTYAEFYSMLGYGVSSVDSVSSATTSKNAMFANEYTSEVTESGYTIYGVKVPVYVEEGASESLLAAVTFNADPETAEDGVQYWTVSGSTVTAPTLETKATVTDATATLSTSSNWGDYLVAITETSTSNLRNTRSDEGFAVGSNILGIVVTTEEGNSYGLTHMNNIWVQTYEFAFNADDANTAGLVGETISTVTYIVPEGLYVYNFADGIYVKPAAAEEITGSFKTSGSSTIFVLDSALSSAVEDATISITYKVGRTTYTLLEATEVGTNTAFTLSESIPDETVPTVTISSSTYSDITVSYPMFDWQKTELTALVTEANALVTAAEDPAYSYDTLAAHAAEGQEILDNNGSASEAKEIISELTELIEAATPYYGTMTLTYEEFYSCLVGDASSVDAVSSATTGKYSMFANESISEVTDAGYTIYGVTNVPVKVLPSVTSEQKALITADEDGAEAPAQYWTVNANGVTATTLNVAATVTDATAELSTSSNWGDYLVAITESSTSYLRNTRSDEGFAVGSNILGIVVKTTDGSSYGLTHMNNIWVQTYEFAFNADDANTAGLVGKTISSVTFIVPDASYVYSFADGIYVKPDYTATAISGMFSNENSVFTLDSAIPGAIQDATITITYKVGRTTYTLLSETTIGSTLSFTLETAVPETDENGDAVEPTVTISSSNYADIEAYYGGLSWQSDLTDCTAVLSTTSYTYDGTAKTPAVTVTAADGTVLTEGTDYVVYYSNNVSAGTATVTIVGTGTYGGTLTKTFTIQKAASSSSSSTTVKDCLTLDSDGVFRYYENGVFTGTYSGVVSYDGGLFFINDSLVDKNANGLCLYNDVWYFVSEGQVQLEHTGLALYDGEWFYITDGILDTTVNGLIPYDNATFLVAAGRLLLDYNGLWLNASSIGGDDQWYFIAAGKVQNVTQVVMYDGEFFYVVNGVLASDYNGTIEYDGATFLVVAGQLYANV